jgi:hypothetical protein
MSMAQGRRCAWLQAGPVDAEVLQAKHVAERALETPPDCAREGLRIDVLSSTWRGFGGHNERSRRQSFHDGEPNQIARDNCSIGAPVRCLREQDDASAKVALLRVGRCT